MDILKCWKDGLINHANEALSHIVKSWIEIGLSGEKLTACKKDVKEKIVTILENVVTDVEQEKLSILDSIENLKEKISFIESALLVSHKKFSNDMPLTTLSHELTFYLSNLELQVEKLTSEFKEMQQNEKELCLALEEQQLNGFPLIPSELDKKRIQSRINDLNQIKNERIEQLTAIQSNIESFMVYFGSDNIIDKFEDVIQSICYKPSYTLTKSFLNAAKEANEYYSNRYHVTQLEEENLNNKINSLRSRLGMPPYVIPVEKKKSAYFRIDHAKIEINSLNALRLKNIRNLIEKCQIELEELWSSSFVGIHYCTAFRSSILSDDSEDTLSILEDEINKWKRFKLKHVDFFATLSVFLDTLQQIKTIEEKRKDPNVLKNRGGILLKLDKEDKKLRLRDLPQQTALIQSIIQNECSGSDAELFSAVCIEGQSLADFQLMTTNTKENNKRLMSFEDQTFDTSRSKQNVLLDNVSINPVSCSTVKKTRLMKH